MSKCPPTAAPVVKGEKFGDYQCPMNKIQSDQMKFIPYASAVGSLMHAQVCTHPDLAYIIIMLGSFKSKKSRKGPPEGC